MWYVCDEKGREGKEWGERDYGKNIKKTTAQEKACEGERGEDTKRMIC